jgi:hypothetical protein
MGYGHIPKKHAQAINHFYQNHFNPWLNLHRPSMFATSKISPKGKVVKVYKHEDVKTPLEALVLLDKQGLATLKTISILPALLVRAQKKTDLAAAQEMQREKSKLFAGINEQKRCA